MTALQGTHVYAVMVRSSAPLGYHVAPLYSGPGKGKICAGPMSDTTTTVYLLDGDDGQWFRDEVAAHHGVVTEQEVEL